jgi:hypothetical protein
MDDLILSYLETGDLRVILSAGLTSKQTVSYDSEGYNFLNSTIISNTTTERKIKILNTLFATMGPLSPAELAAKLEAPIIAQVTDQPDPLQTTAMNLATHYLPPSRLAPLLTRLKEAGYHPSPQTLQLLEEHMNQNHHNTPGDIAELLLIFS